MRRALSIIFGIMTAFHYGTVAADDSCHESTDELYTASMMHVRDAVAAQDFEAALSILTVAVERYEFAPLRYSRARAFHRVGRFEEAEAEYTTFLAAFEDCDDPSGLMDSARDYRSLAMAEYARQVADEASRQLEENQSDSEQARIDVEVAENDPGVPEPVLGVIERAPESESRLVPWIITGAGGALLVTGLIYDVARSDLLDDRQAAADAGDQARFNELNESVRRGKVVEGVLFGVGAAAVIGGVVYYFIRSSDEAPTESVSVSFVERGAVFGVGGVF